MENILQSYFNRRMLDDVDVTELEQLVSRYPYLGPAQYFLAKKYFQIGDPGYVKQVAKTTLFFNNPHWFNLLLHDQLFNKNEFEESILSQATTQPSTTSGDAPVTDEGKETFVHTELIPDEKKEEQFTFQEEEQSLPGHINTEEPVETYTENTLEGAAASIAGNEPAEIEIAVSGEVMPETPLPADTQQEYEAKEDMLPTARIEEEDTTEVSEGEVPGPHGEILPKLPFEGKELKLNELPPEGRIPIEPLYTIDYFASQGIKLQQIEGKDKLSIKLRSFTEWLKTMKRIHPEKLENESEEQVQSKIQHIAEHSNEVNEVVTEAMAEVFARQGMFQKAIEVYQKLSLQNPDKRAYFAAKISKLNDH